MLYLRGYFKIILQHSKELVKLNNPQATMSSFFEFHFNGAPPSPSNLHKGILARPKNFIQKLKGEQEIFLFDTFCFSPSKKEEKNLGHLSLAIELSGIPAKKNDLLKNLAEILKKEYYLASAQTSEEALKVALNKANDFLTEDLEKTEQTILPKIHAGIFACSPDCQINISKANNIDILLLRPNEAFDLAENIGKIGDRPQEPKEVCPQFFQNTIEGKLQNNDKIFLATSNIKNFLMRYGILEELSEAQTPEEIKEIFLQKQEALSLAFGSCIVALIQEEPQKFFFSLPSIFKPKPEQNSYTKGIFYIILLALLIFLGLKFL